MKTAVVFLLVVVIAAVAVEGYQNQTRIIGNVRAGDRLLDGEILFKKGKANRVLVSNYRYPQYGAGRQIHCIKVIDKDLSGYNGDLYLNKGGVNQNFVDISIRSKKGYGINYDVQIWGN